MEKKKGNKKEVERVEFGPDFNPDDLDLREDNDLTEEQYKNTHHEKQMNKSKNKNQQNSQQ